MQLCVENYKKTVRRESSLSFEGASHLTRERTKANFSKKLDFKMLCDKKKKKKKMSGEQAQILGNTECYTPFWRGQGLLSPAY